ncbi:MAG: LytTR family DNA-binding domain-containing protein [Variovorax sp.]
MNNLSIVIAEDDITQTQALTAMLKAMRPDWRVVAIARTGPDMLDYVERYQPDFALLDIGLPGPQTGLEIAAEIARQCPVVFLTGEAGHAVDAYELGAADYIVKPLSSTRLEKALLRIERILQSRLLHHRVFSMGREEGGPEGARYMQLISGRKLVWAPVSEVRFLQAETGYTRVFLENTSGVIRQGLLTVHQRLNQQEFWQVHRGTVVNARYVEELERDDLGRLSVRIQGYQKPLAVSKNQERLFRDDFVY